MQLAHQAAFRLGQIEVRPATREVVTPDGREVLQPRVMQVLVALASARGEVVSRDDLIASCWDGRIVGEDAITFVLGKLRKLAQSTGAFTIETIPRVGYRLVAEREAEAEVDAQAPPAWPEPTTETPEPSAAPEPPPASARKLTRRVALGAGMVVGALTVAAGGVTAWRILRPPKPAPVTVAVLPFDDLAPGPQTRFLADGLAREVRNSLSRVAGLSVIADASSFALAAKGLGDAEIGKRLRASLLLKGSVRAAENEVRITTELVDAISGVQVWADSHDSQGGNLFKLQDNLPGAVIQELIGRIGADVIREPPPARRRDPEVFRLMLGADQLIEQTRALRMVGQEKAAEDGADEAHSLADQALAIDPSDAGALVVLAALVRNGWSRAFAAQPLTPAQRGEAAAVLLRKALVTDPNDPSALAALADILRRIEWRWTESESLFRRAIAIDPNHLEGHWGYCYLLSLHGRDVEAMAHARAIMRLDPETVWRRLALPRIHYCLGDRKTAAALFDRELVANPSNLFLVRELYLMGITDPEYPGGLKGIVARVEELWRGKARPPALETLLTRARAGMEAQAGRPAALLALIDADVATYDASMALTGTQQGRASVDLLYIYGLEYAWAGETGRGIALLDRALAGRSTYWVPTMPYGVAPLPAKVRADPRYAALWRKEPKRIELVSDRLAALQRGQMAGFLPDGRRVTPAVPPDDGPKPING